MSQLKEIIAPIKAGRLDSFLSEYTSISRSKIKKYIQNGAVTIIMNPALTVLKNLMRVILFYSTFLHKKQQFRPLKIH